jgi:hypothetical protein
VIPRISRRPELEELPAVDLAVEISRRLVDRSSIDVVHQPLRAHHVAVDLHVERRLGDAAAGEVVLWTNTTWVRSRMLSISS